MAANAILFATMALVSNGSAESPTMTSQKHEFKAGYGNIESCRKVENGFHLGNGPIIKRGNKLISRVESPDGHRIIETTTFCVEY